MEHPVMQVQIDFWQLLLAIAGLVASFATVVWLFGSALIRQFEKRLGERFKGIQEDLTKRASEDMEVSKQLRQFEKDFLKFQVDMPVLYVRREDYIRGQTVIESKLDALYSKLEVVQIQGAKRD
jgi:hypothetical protein